MNCTSTFTLNIYAKVFQYRISLSAHCIILFFTTHWAAFCGKDWKMKQKTESKIKRTDKHSAHNYPHTQNDKTKQKRKKKKKQEQLKNNNCFGQSDLILQFCSFFMHQLLSIIHLAKKFLDTCKSYFFTEIFHIRQIKSISWKGGRCLSFWYQTWRNQLLNNRVPIIWKETGTFFKKKCKWSYSTVQIKMIAEQICIDEW